VEKIYIFFGAFATNISSFVFRNVQAGAAGADEVEGDRPERQQRDRDRGADGGSRGRTSGRGGREIVASKSVDYSDNELAARETIDRKKSRSKSTDDVTERGGQPCQTGHHGQPSSRRGVICQQQQTEMHQAPHASYSYVQDEQGDYVAKWTCGF